MKEKKIYTYLPWDNCNISAVFIFKSYVFVLALIVLLMKEFGYLEGTTKDTILFIIMKEFNLSLIITIIFMGGILIRLIWNIGVWIYNKKLEVKENEFFNEC